MNDNSTYMYGMRVQARCLASVVKNTDRTRFLAGSCEIKQGNEVHVIDFDEEKGEISSLIFAHQGEINYITSSPSEENTLMTCSSTLVDGKSKYYAAMLKYPLGLWNEKPSSMSKTPHMETVFRLEGFDGQVNRICWEPLVESPSKISVCDKHNIKLFSLADTTNAETTIKCSYNLSNLSWNPHASSEVVTLNDNAIRGWDLRSAKQTFAIENANHVFARDIDFNPNRPYYFATVGDDAKLRFYDQRNTNAPLKEILQHTHWVWCVEFNPFYDQLLLTGGSDCRVALHHVSSLSSATLHHYTSSESGTEGTATTEKERKLAKTKGSKSNLATGTDKEKKHNLMADATLKLLDQHEDSVYSCAWSRADPWIFASLSYDGRIIVNSVPSEEKYKIIL